MCAQYACNICKSELGLTLAYMPFLGICGAHLFFYCIICKHKAETFIDQTFILDIVDSPFLLV